MGTFLIGSQGVISNGLRQGMFRKVRPFVRSNEVPRPLLGRFVVNAYWRKRLGERHAVARPDV